MRVKIVLVALLIAMASLAVASDGSSDVGKQGRVVRKIKIYHADPSVILRLLLGGNR